MKTIFTSILLCFGITLFAQTDWEEKASLPGLSRHHPVTFTLNGEGYVVAGVAPPFVLLNDVQKYDPSTDTWTTLPSFPGPARGFAYGAAHNGKAYMGFGLGPGNQRLNDLWEYDPNTGQWTELTSCGCTGRRHPAFVITSNGKLYVGLGDDASGNTQDWWEYDIATDTWEQQDNLPGEARHHPYYFAIGTDAYAGFGHGNGIFNDFYKFNSLDGEWTELNDFPGEERVAGAQFDYGGYGYIISGEGVDHQNLDEGEFYRYSPDNDTWYEQEPHPGAGRWASGAFVIDDVIYHVAGEDENSNILRDVWAYDLNKTVFVAGEDEVNSNTASLFPNPADDFLDITSTANFKVRMLSLDGKLIMEANTTSESLRLDLSSTIPGIYFVEIEGADGITVREKIVKS